MCTTHAAAAPTEEEYTMPCVEALLAGTLALMTGVAQSAPGCSTREPMARKIVENLELLARHAQLSAPMRSMLERLIVHWQGAAMPRPVSAAARTPAAAWMPSPRTLQ
jgi:hypothetical protein